MTEPEGIEYIEHIKFCRLCKDPLGSALDSTGWMSRYVDLEFEFDLCRSCKADFHSYCNRYGLVSDKNTTQNEKESYLAFFVNWVISENTKTKERIVNRRSSSQIMERQFKSFLDEIERNYVERKPYNLLNNTKRRVADLLKRIFFEDLKSDYTQIYNYDMRMVANKLILHDVLITGANKEYGKFSLSVGNSLFCPKEFADSINKIRENFWDTHEYIKVYRNRNIGQNITQ